MSALQHIYVTAHGEWASGPWVGEKAQFGLRLAMVDATAEPTKGAVFTLPVHGDVVADSGSQSGTNGTLTRTWTARIGPTGSTENFGAAEQVDVAEDVWAFLNSFIGSVAATFRFTHVKIAPVLASGAYGATASIYTFTSPLVGSGAGSVLPPEVALAVTFRAAVLGRRGRGRIYLPALTTGNALETDGTVKSAFRSSLVSFTGTLVTNLQNQPGTGRAWRPIVCTMSAGKAQATRPSQVRVGNKFDSQRRRQQQVVETYTSANL